MNLTGANGLGQKAPKTAKKSRKAPRKVSAKRGAYLTSQDRQDGLAHMQWVAQQPCVICGAWPVHVHHVICGRYGQRKASDFDTIPLCPDCHLGPQGIHADKRAWIDRHGMDTDYVKKPSQNEL